MPALIEVATEIDARSDVVFGVELDMDVHAASLASSGETATTSTGRRRVALGDEVTFRARHFGLVWRMTSRITAYEPPHRFVDEQVHGPRAVPATAAEPALRPCQASRRGPGSQT